MRGVPYLWPSGQEQRLGAMVAAVLAGLVGWLAGQMMRHWRQWLRQLQLLERFWWIPIATGLVVGLCLWGLPLAAFSGENQLKPLVLGDWSLSTAILMISAIAKLLMVGLCLETGWRGGQFFPVILASSALGMGLHQWIPWLGGLDSWSAGSGRRQPLGSAVLSLAGAGSGSGAAARPRCRRVGHRTAGGTTAAARPLSGLIAGLIAALAWTLASSLWRSLSTSLNAIQLNGLKNALASLVLLPVLITLPWGQQPEALFWLLTSGGLGIALGDSLYLAALRRLGTRRTLTMESLSPLFAASSGWFTWENNFPQRPGLVLCWSQPPWRSSPCSNRLTTLERDRQSRVQLQGVLMALLAVACGVAGAGVSRSVLISADLTPLQSAACRLLGGLLLLLPWMRIRWRRMTMPCPQPRPRERRWVTVLIATLLGTVLGILLQQIALQQLPLGIATTVLSTAPVMALLVARAEKDRLGWQGLMASCWQSAAWRWPC